MGIFFLGATSVSLAGQAAAPATLTLQEAIELARRNNPDFLQQSNDVGVANWAVRDAYGALLPSASAGVSYSYSAAGNQRIGNIPGSDLGLETSTDYYSSSASLSLSYRLSAQQLLAPGQQKANRRATVAGIDAAGFNLEANVVRQYLAVLRAQENVTLAQQELESAKTNQMLADAKVATGGAIPLESKQAAVQVGRVEVQLLQAQNAVANEKLRLMQLLGVQFNEQFELTSTFTVSDVPGSREAFTSAALSGHPTIRSARANEEASVSSYKMAKSAYLPSLSLSTGLSGFMRQAGNSDFLVAQARAGAPGSLAQCELLRNISNGLSTPLPGAPTPCSLDMFLPTPEQEQAIRDRNNVFPFKYEGEPLGLSMSISLPIFDGFSRERQLQTSRVAVTDAELRVRAEELRIRTEVGAAYANATTGRRSVELEARNRDLAAEQLELARERYRFGAGTFLELNDAQTVKARADQAYLNALYNYHEALAALESAVGRPLAQVTGENR
jgi:outer membrane protein